jgi:hypothetical protein
MAPEQARGAWDAVGPRSDVYSLGATLYHLLAGRPPFTRRSVQEIIQRVAAGDAAEPLPGVPAALVAVCRKAMAADPSGRYESALALAADVEHWLADEPVGAWREPWGVRVRRWVRRHARLVTGTAAALAVGVLGLAGVAWQGELKRQAVAAEQAVTAQQRDEKAAALETAQQRLTQIEKSNDVLTSIFADLDIRRVKAGNEPLEAVLAKRLVTAAEQLEGEAVGAPLVVAGLQNRLGRTLLILGHPQEAIPLFVKACETRRAGLGADHPDTLLSMNNLAEGYRTAGKLDLALPLYEETLRLKRAKLGPDHPETLAGMNNLAEGYHAAGKLDLALPLYEETLKLRKAKLGPDHPDTYRSMANLATSYQAARKLDLALPLLEETVRLTKARLGADHPDTLVCMNNLAAGYHAAGKLDLALPLLEEALKLQKAKLGPDHLDTLSFMNNLAVGYRAAGKLDLALPLYEESLRIHRAKLGADHPDTLDSMSSLAACYRNTGKLDLALPLFQAAAAGMERLRFQYQYAGPIVNNLSDCYERLRQFDRAEPWRRKWLAVVKERAGADSPAYAAELAGLGLNLSRQSKWADAEAALRDCLTIRERKQPDAWTTYNTRSMLGGALAEQAKYSDAEPLLAQGYQGLKQRATTIPGVARVRLAEAAERIVQLYDAWHKPAEAAKWRAELADVQWAIADAPPQP